jgi:hypothetical protein
MPGAMDWLGVCYRMADHVAQEPTLIAQLVEMAMVAMTNVAAQTILDSGDVSPAAVATLRDHVDRLQVAPRFGRAMLAEPAMGLDTFRMIGTGRRSLPGSPEAAANGSLTRPYTRALAVLMRPYWKLEECNYIRYMSQLIEESKQPYRLAAAKPDTDQLIRKGLGSTMAAIMVPAVGKAGGARDRALAQLDILRTGLDLKLYKHATGRYPATLGALGPNRLRDVFTGRDFFYERRGQGFRLYSVGMNLRDDKGVGYQRKPPGAPRADTDDIVWECVR